MQSLYEFAQPLVKPSSTVKVLWIWSVANSFLRRRRWPTYAYTQIQGRYIYIAIRQQIYSLKMMSNQLTLFIWNMKNKNGWKTKWEYRWQKKGAIEKYLRINAPINHSEILQCVRDLWTFLMRPFDPLQTAWRSVNCPQWETFNSRKGR